MGFLIDEFIGFPYTLSIFCTFFFLYMNPENTPDPKQETPKKPISLLEEILAKSWEVPTHQNIGIENNEIPEKPENKTPKKPREPISFATFMKLIGSLLFVAIIFLGSFLAYISFNPDQAIFFARIFHINLEDIKWWLAHLVNGSFGAIFFCISVVWIVTLFRAFWTSKELKRKRLLGFLTAGIVWIFLFGILTFWIYLFNVINTRNYSNPDGQILVYDNNLFTHEGSKSYSQITDTTNMIGPITVLFDLRSNAETLTKDQLFRISSYSINFDGAKCTNGTSLITGNDPSKEQSIICTFDKVKDYNIYGTYTGKDSNWKEWTLDIKIPSIEIRGLVDIKNQKDIRNNPITTLDASALRQLGTPKWLYLDTNKEVNENHITETVTKTPRFVCLKVYSDACDRVFVLEDTNNQSPEWEIIAKQDTVNALQYYFTFTGVNIPENQITNIEWLINDGNVVCKKDDNANCTYTFTKYGDNKIKLIFKVVTGEQKEIEKDINILQPLTIERHLKITDAGGNFLNKDNVTYQKDLKSFVLWGNIAPSDTLSFDARDVLSTNPGYILSNVRWIITSGNKTEEKVGKNVDITFNEPLRYNIQAIYTFTSQTNIPGVPDETASDNIIIDIERKNLIPHLEKTVSSDYVPSVVTFDASRSESTIWEIKKFIFDFGDGKAPTEWDAIQEYQYTTPWDKTITLTIVGADGETASTKTVVVLKNQAKTIDFIPSISPGINWSPVDFEAKWTTGQIDDYIWDFGDNTEPSHWYTTTHTYTQKGNYTVTLNIRYSDGTSKSQQKTFEVMETL